MATAEQLLHEAQYAFQSISFGESRENQRNHRRATSLCKKIIRKYPTSMEAQEAHAILRRLGEEAYISKMPLVHRHPGTVAAREEPSARPSTPLIQPREMRTELPSMTEVSDDIVPLDWRGLWSVLSKISKTAWGATALGLVILYEIFGVFVFLPLLTLLLFSGAFRRLLQPKDRREFNEMTIRVNAWIDERLRNNA